MSKDLILKALMEGKSVAAPARPKVVAVAPQAASGADIDLLAPLPLGYNQGRYFYLSRCDHQVHEIAASAHTPNTLMAIARLSYWQTRFKGSKGPDWQAATDFVMETCRKVGIFNPDNIRGRGVSFDSGRSVLHLGSRLIVDGTSQNGLTLPDSELIYEKGLPMKIQLGEPLSVEQTYKMVDICNMFSWASPDMGLLFAGWIVTAPICGALPWRTHVWLTGQMGSGKSWVMTNFVKPLVGPLGFSVQSKTTEAGIRQHLRIDARPIIFDEAETQNERDRDRLQQVLDLARQSSSEDGFDILKGTVSGREIRFRIRSSFLFSSINFGATQSADESRIIPLSLVPMTGREDAAAHFDQIKQMVIETVTPEYAGSLLARTLRLLPILRNNIKVFSRALSDTMTSRQADTIGCLIAGYYSLQSDSMLTLQEAKDFVKDRSWINAAAIRTETEADHDKAVAHLLEQVLRVSPSMEWSIAEAIRFAHEDNAHEAHRVLGRHGIKVKDNHLFLGRSHHIIDKMFTLTAWSKVWDRTILQYPGASLGTTTTDFSGYKKKAIIIPLKKILA